MSTKRFPTGYMDKALDPTSLREIIAEAAVALKDVDFDTIVGTGFSGGVVIPSLAMALDKDFVLIRKEDDDSHHGPGRLLGTLGQRWIFVDDFVSSGATERRVLAKVEEASKPSKDYWGDKTEIPTRYVGTYTYVNYDKPGWKPVAPCDGCGIVGKPLSGTQKCPDCVEVDVHNYRALTDGRMKRREYPTRTPEEIR